MRICFIAMEIFAWGKYGGFGRATRTIGLELVKRGIEVFAIVPRRGNQKLIENLDGIQVHAFEPNRPYKVWNLARRIDADIYHSEEPSLGTYIAMKSMPNRTHLVTCRDTRDKDDWNIEKSLPTKSRFQVTKNQIYEDIFLVRWAVQNATHTYAASYFVQAKAHKHYRLAEPPTFLPTPISIPTNVKKSEIPTVCFVARWDRRKRPELFFNLAKSFPNVKFIAVGASHDKEWDASLRKSYENLPNLEMPGFVDQFENKELEDIYEQSWILVNTAAREGLPNSFIEAASHCCAILSSVNPDQFASQFGYFAQNDDFIQGLKFLLENDRWKTFGEEGYRYVKETFSTDVAIDRHIEIYESFLKKNRKQT